jgi:tetratricopeptide (TPR) repeat protein
MKSLRTASLLCFVAILSVGLSFVPLSGSQDPQAKPDTAVITTVSAAPAKIEVTLPAGIQYYLDGLKLFREGKFSTAATDFEAAANTETAALLKSHAYAWLARAELHLHNLSEAEGAAERALENAKDASNAQTAMAEVYFRQGKIAESQQILLRLVKSQAAGSRTFFALAKIYLATGNYKAAKALLEVAHKMDPKDPDVEEARVWSLTREEHLQQLKKRIEDGNFEDQQERDAVAGMIAILEDRQKNQNRTCKLVSNVTKTEIRLSPLLYDAKRIRGYGLSVKVNDALASLMLDSDAGGILVSSKIAEKAGLSKIADSLVHDVGDAGPAKGYLAFAEKLKIGDLEFENCYVEVINNRKALEDDGLIGTNVFENYLIDLNFPEEKLRLSQLPSYPNELRVQPSLNSEPNTTSHLHNNWTPPEFADFEKVYRFGHMLLLPLDLNKAPAHLFLLDTGAFDNSVSPAAAKEASKISTDSDIRVKGLIEEVKTGFTTGNMLVTFGHFQQRGDLIAFDMTGISNSVGTEVSGTLGLAMLEHLEIKLDYRDNLVQFRYEANRIH